MKCLKNLCVVFLSILMLLSMMGCSFVQPLNEEEHPVKEEDELLYIYEQEEDMEMSDENWEVGLEEGEEYIPDEETPLAGNPVTSTKTTTKTTTKKTNLSKKSKSTYTTEKDATKTSTSTAVSGNTQTTTSVKVDQHVKYKYTKGSKVKKTTTTVKTTITTTKVTIPAGEVSIRDIASAAHENVLAAYEAKGYSVLVDTKAASTGEFSTRKKLITVKRIDGVVYHELGHFVAFMNRRCDISDEFIAIFAKEKSLYTASNKSYILSNSAEYFAESYKNYVEAPDTLKLKRPLTYEYIKQVVESM